VGRHGGDGGGGRERTLRAAGDVAHGERVLLAVGGSSVPSTVVLGLAPGVPALLIRGLLLVLATAAAEEGEDGKDETDADTDTDSNAELGSAGKALGGGPQRSRQPSQ
jgi:hypothetical protein